MSRRWLRVFAIFGFLLAVGLLASDVAARRGGGGGMRGGGGFGGGGMSRGGFGGGGLSRSGPAMGGSMRHGGFGGGGFGGSGIGERPGGGFDRPGGRPGDRPGTRPGDRPGRDPDRVDNRQDRRQDRQDTRPDRQEYWQYEEYHGWDEYYDDGWKYAMGATLTAAAFASLTCQLQTIVVDGATYYQCADLWYTRTYGGGSTTYIVVNAPPGY